MYTYSGLSSYLPARLMIYQQCENKLRSRLDCTFQTRFIAKKCRTSLFFIFIFFNVGPLRHFLLICHVAISKLINFDRLFGLVLSVGRLVKLHLAERFIDETLINNGFVYASRTINMCALIIIINLP